MKKWDIEKIKREALNFIEEHKLNRMPKQKELRKYKRMDLLSAISKNGGMIHIGELLGYPSTRNEWTEEKIKVNIFKSMKILKIETMPTSNQIKMLKNLRGLDSAISRTGGYGYWAEKLNISQNTSGTKLGKEYEIIAKNEIEKKGHSVSLMRARHPFDLLVDGNVKIDVKVATPTFDAYGKRIHVLNTKREHPSCDIYIVYLLDESQEIESTLIIPSKYVKITTLSIRENSKYMKFKDKWRYIDRFTEFYSMLA